MGRAEIVEGGKAPQTITPPLQRKTQVKGQLAFFLVLVFVASDTLFLMLVHVLVRVHVLILLLVLEHVLLLNPVAELANTRGP